MSKRHINKSMEHMTVQDPPSRHPKEHVSPSRWNTSEFYLYYAAFIIVLPLMFKAAIDMSSGTCMHGIITVCSRQCILSKVQVASLAWMVPRTRHGQ
jgi:hypothetical protein